MLAEFRKFALRGNLIDLAVGIIIGSAFTAIVSSLVNDILMPPLGLLLGGVDFAEFFALLKAGDPAGPYATLADAQAAGAVTINYGIFINAIITFLIVAFVVFVLVRSINRLEEQMRKKEEEAPAEPTTKDCPYCLSTIPLKATRCAYCTAELAT
jgi:large conductance mechanosensitive channel